MSAPAAHASAPARRSGFSLPGAGSVAWLYVLVALMAAMHLSMALGRSINWDEFWFYSQVEQVARGEFIQPLQTIHTRFFAWWLPAMPGSEVDHILIARLVMLACLAITASGIFLAAEKFSDRRTALIAVSAYLGAGFVLHHGASFRVDPIVTACLSTGFAIAARTRLSLPSILALGAVIGLGAMVTIKMVLWAPAFAGIALLRWEEEAFDWRYIMRWFAAGLVALVSFALLYLLHSSGMDAAAAQDSAAGTLGRSAEKVFGFLDTTNLDAALKALLTSLPLVIFAAMVPVVTSKSDWTWTRKASLIAIWFPVLTPLFYFNSHPYFYAFILPPVAMATAVAIPLLVERYGTAVVAGAVAGSALMIWAVDARGVTERQEALVSAVHEAFPEPVAYFDCCGMIGSFEKANMFRTSWGVERYLESGRPLLLEAMRERPVPLLVDNNREFSGAITGEDESTFHPNDVAAMRETYVRLWGDIHVAGRDLAAGEALVWNVLVPGEYRVSGDLVVNGERIRDGDVVSLDRGEAVLENISEGSVRIIWGKDTRAPSTPAPTEPYWTAF